MRGQLFIIKLITENIKNKKKTKDLSDELFSELFFLHLTCGIYTNIRRIGKMVWARIFGGGTRARRWPPLQMYLAN